MVRELVAAWMLLTYLQTRYGCGCCDHVRKVSILALRQLWRSRAVPAEHSRGCSKAFQPAPDAAAPCERCEKGSELRLVLISCRK